MSCEEIRSLLPDYWAGTLAEGQVAVLQAHLHTCDACREEAAALGGLWQRLELIGDEQPSPVVQARFDAMLTAWREGTAAGRVLAFDRGRTLRPRMATWMPVFQIAAAVLLLVSGFFAGKLVPDRAAADQMAEMRGELRTMREMVAVSLLQQQSAAERLRGVTWSHQIEQPGEQVLDALLQTMRHDANVNVRLAAIDALRQFGRADHVRTGLVEAVGTQNSPLVQIELINALVEMRERRSREVLQRLAADERVDGTVRQRARWGLDQIG